MNETLFDTYLPLLLWTGLGALLFRLLPDRTPRLLGRALYWVGMPIEIMALARRTDFPPSAQLTPIATVSVLLLGLGLSWLALQIIIRRTGDTNSRFDLSAIADALAHPAQQGSFILATISANTGFVGLAIAPFLIDERYFSLLITYNVTQSVLGNYGMGVWVASAFGGDDRERNGWKQLRDVVVSPSLWSFTLGILTRTVPFPAVVETGLQSSLWVVIPAAFLLMGMRVSQLQGWQNLKLVLIPAVLKAIVLPALVGIILTLCGVSGDIRLAIVLMSGMPTAFASLILAEEYNLDRQLLTSSAIVTTIALLVMIPLWMAWFG
jgi:malate permease and related proteins